MLHQYVTQSHYPHPLPSPTLQHGSTLTWDSKTDLSRPFCITEAYFQVKEWLLLYLQENYTTAPPTHTHTQRFDATASMGSRKDKIGLEVRYSQSSPDLQTLRCWCGAYKLIKLSLKATHLIYQQKILQILIGRYNHIDRLCKMRWNSQYSTHFLPHKVSSEGMKEVLLFMNSTESASFGSKNNILLCNMFVWVYKQPTSTQLEECGFALLLWF